MPHTRSEIRLIIGCDIIGVNQVVLVGNVVVTCPLVAHHDLGFCTPYQRPDRFIRLDLGLLFWRAS